jgi:MFS transporter, ACS family, pantothenate transporter
MGHAEEDIGPYGLDAEAGANDSQDQLIVTPIKTWKGYLWDTWDLPKDQRWLLFKLDAFVLTFASVSAAPAPDFSFFRKKFKEN